MSQVSCRAEGRAMGLLCGFMAPGVSLDWAEIQSNILFIWLYMWREAGAAAIHSELPAQQILHSQGCVHTWLRAGIPSVPLFCQLMKV